MQAVQQSYWFIRFVFLMAVYQILVSILEHSDSFSANGVGLFSLALAHAVPSYSPGVRMGNSNLADLPLTLLKVNETRAPFAITDHVQDGDYGFFSSYRGLHIADMSNPTAPEWVGFLQINDVSACLAVNASTIFFCGDSGSVYLCDVSSKQNPVLLDSISVSSQAIYQIIPLTHTNVLFIVDELFHCYYLNLDEGLVQLVDTQSLGISAVQTLTLSSNESVAFIHSDSTVYVLNISNPIRPSIIGQCAFLNDLSIFWNHKIFLDPAEHFLYTTTRKFLQIIDISMISQPKTVSQLSVSNNDSGNTIIPYIQTFCDKTLYVNTFKFYNTPLAHNIVAPIAITIVSVADNLNPKVLASIPAEGTRYIQLDISGAYVYASGWDAFAIVAYQLIFSVINTVQFNVRNSISLPSLVEMRVISPTESYVRSQDSIYRINTTLSTQPQTETIFTTNPDLFQTNSFKVLGNGTYIFGTSYFYQAPYNAFWGLQKIGDNYTLIDEIPLFHSRRGYFFETSEDQSYGYFLARKDSDIGEMYVLSLKNMSAPVVVNTTAIAQVGNVLYVSGNHLYGYAFNQLKLFDIADARNPQLLSEFVAKNDMLFACIESPDGQWLYVNGFSNLYVLDISTHRLVSVSTIILPDASIEQKLFIADSFLYVPRNSGTYRLDIRMPSHPILVNVFSGYPKYLMAYVDQRYFYADTADALVVIDTFPELYVLEQWITTPQVGLPFELAIPLFNTTTHQEFSAANLTISAHYGYQGSWQTPPAWLSISPGADSSDGRIRIRGIPEKEYATGVFPLEIGLSDSSGAQLFDQVLNFNIQSSLSLGLTEGGSIQITSPSKTAVIEITLPANASSAIIVNPSTAPVSSFFNPTTREFTAFGPVDALNMMLTELHFSLTQLKHPLVYPLTIEVTDLLNNPLITTGLFNTTSFILNRGISLTDFPESIQLVSGEARLFDLTRFFKHMDDLPLTFTFTIVNENAQEVAADASWMRLEKETGSFLFAPADNANPKVIWLNIVAQDSGNQQLSTRLCVKLEWSAEQYMRLLLTIASIVGGGMTAFKVYKATNAYFTKHQTTVKQWGASLWTGCVKCCKRRPQTTEDPLAVALLDPVVDEESVGAGGLDSIELSLQDSVEENSESPAPGSPRSD